MEYFSGCERDWSESVPHNKMPGNLWQAVLEVFALSGEWRCTAGRKL